MTLAYAKDREQFGAPIGSFQALKHRLADLHVLVDSTRELIYAAARVAADGSGADLRVIAAAAKAAANKAYLRATEETIQMHGGIGFTWEHDAHLFYKRALVSCELLGSSHQQLERVAVAVGV
jgi:alkylation response protein AidB-like acyl-CoA dehydrogenase